jgi:hypothetical protein
MVDISLIGAHEFVTPLFQKMDFSFMLSQQSLLELLLSVQSK